MYQSNICDSNLHAVDHANLRGSAAYIASGVGACQCRHMLVRPGGVGDLQKGERYVLNDELELKTNYVCNLGMRTWTMFLHPLFEGVRQDGLSSRTTSRASGTGTSCLGVRICPSGLISTRRATFSNTSYQSST